MAKVKFTEKEVKKYLDKCIRYWRKQRDSKKSCDNYRPRTMAEHYIDAFQSVRTSLFGELLPKE